MKYALTIIAILLYGSAVSAHPHHDCLKDKPACEHEHPGR